MILYTITNRNDHEIKTENNYYLKKSEYSKEEYEEIINQAKQYYFSYRVISDDTDMSDRYHSDNLYFYSVHPKNLIVKDKKFYGVILHGLEKHHGYYLIATIDDKIIDDSEVNGYNSIDRTYELLSYDFNSEALDLCVKYYAICTVTTTRIKDGKEELFSKNTYYKYPLAFDAVTKDEKVIGVKIDGLDFIIEDPSTHKQSKQKEDFAGYKYIQTNKYKLVYFNKDN